MNAYRLFHLVLLAIFGVVVVVRAQAPEVPVQNAPMAQFAKANVDSTPVILDGVRLTLGQIRAAVNGIGPAQQAAETNRKLAVDRLALYQAALAYQVAYEAGRIREVADVQRETLATLKAKNPTMVIASDLTITIGK